MAAFIPKENGALMSALLLENAVRIAVEAHRGQLQKNGLPYVLHPLAVMQRMKTPEEMMAAVLHDVVEDTPVTLEQLRKEGFPEAIVEAVDCVTRRDGQGEEEYLERVAGNMLARRVKLADLEENMDVRRIPEPVEKDWLRMAKYRRAWERLKE